MKMFSEQQLGRILALLDQQIEELGRLGLEGTCSLLRIARLDLRMQMHDISDKELRALCDVIEQQSAMPSSTVLDFPPRSVGKLKRS